MNMVHASIYLFLPQFLSSVFFSVPSADLLAPWLNSFLSTLYIFFVPIVNEIFFLVPLSDNTLLMYKMPLISEY